MKKEEVEQRVIKRIREKFFPNDDNVVITSTTDICLHLGADSLDEVELLQDLESEFNCSLSEINIGFFGVTTVEEIVNELMKVLKDE